MMNAIDEWAETWYARKTPTRSYRGFTLSLFWCARKLASSAGAQTRNWLQLIQTHEFLQLLPILKRIPRNPFGHNSGSRHLFQSWLPQRFWTLQTARAFKMVLIHSQLSRVKVDRAQIEHVQYILNKVRLSQWSLHILIRYNFVAKVLDCHKSPPRIVRAMHRHNFAFQKVETCGLFQKLAPYELSSAGLLNGGQFFFCQKRKTMPI